jgi:hypothetical protein
VKLLIEKINTYVPIDDLYVAAYGGEAGDWKKDSMKERQRIYSLLENLRRKLPKDWFEGKASKGYMLSDLSVRKKIKRTNADTGFLGMSLLSFGRISIFRRGNIRR